MRFLVLIAVALWAAAPSYAGEESAAVIAARIECFQLLGPPGPSKAIPGLAVALRDIQTRRGERVPMTVEQLDAQVRDMALFLVGQRTPEQMKGNHFFDSKSNKIEMEDSLRGLYDTDVKLVQKVINEGIQKELGKIRYDGKSATAVKKELNAEEVVVLFTHQLGKLQADTDAQLSRYPDLKGKRAVWLVGAESSDPLQAKSLADARLVEHSIGGEFSFKLSAAKKIVIAGGALDQCLMQTIQSIVMKTKGNIVIEVVQPLSYIDIIGSQHMTVPEFMKGAKEELPEYENRLRREVESMMEEIEYEVEKGKPVPKGTLPSLVIKNKTRTIQLVFRP